MSDPSPILDYASPRKRGKVRLPAESTLTYDVGEGEVTIVERLRGLGNAYGAIAFAGAILAWDAAWLVTELLNRRGNWVPVALVLSFLCALIVSVLVPVILQTWRRTTLHARDGQLTLSFGSLLGEKRFVWSRDELTMRVAVTFMQDQGPTLGELQLHPSGGRDVLLLTDHRIAEVQKIHDLLSDALEGKPVALAHAAPPREINPDHASPLVDLHRSIRERRH